MVVFSLSLLLSFELSFFVCIRENCLSNPADVKELIPEFFYMSDFLRNSNGFSLGVLSDGRVIDDVMLPPWADNSPEKFIRINREALESVWKRTEKESTI